jgi:DNA-binding phage protein
MSLENAAKCGIDLTQVLAALHTFNKAVISHLGNMLKDQEENLIGLLRAVAAARGIPTSQLIAERHGVARVCAQTYDHDPDYEDEL